MTAYGVEWLAASPVENLVVDPGRLGRMLADAGGRFGAGFLERSQEAVRPYQALAFLACCAMGGAAAESVVLALAVAKLGDEPKATKLYTAAGAAGASRPSSYGARQRPCSVSSTATWTF